ncbi:hypothetical protein LP7551_02087 [Roseibium album]|nr:hypothetical protein LP7551_02087 [Roseibium album]
MNRIVDFAGALLAFAGVAVVVVWFYLPAANNTAVPPPLVFLPIADHGSPTSVGPADPSFNCLYSNEKLFCETGNQSSGLNGVAAIFDPTGNPGDLSKVPNEKLLALLSDTNAPGSLFGTPNATPVLEEFKRRQQRSTTVVGEIFPDMVYETEHNAFLTVARGRAGQKDVGLSADAMALHDATNEPVLIEETNTQTTARVGAQLIGAGFKIEPSVIIWRTIPDGMEDTFTWAVTPKKEGDLQLLVVLRNELHIGAETLNLPVSRFPKSITVSVGFWTKFGRFFSGVDTAVGTAKNIGISIAALFGFGGIGAFYAGIRAWRKHNDGATPET